MFLSEAITGRAYDSEDPIAQHRADRRLRPLTGRDLYLPKPSSITGRAIVQALWQLARPPAGRCRGFVNE